MLGIEVVPWSWWVSHRVSTVHDERSFASTRSIPKCSAVRAGPIRPWQVSSANLFFVSGFSWAARIQWITWSAGDNQIKTITTITYKTAIAISLVVPQNMEAINYLSHLPRTNSAPSPCESVRSKEYLLTILFMLDPLALGVVVLLRSFSPASPKYTSLW